MPNQEKTQWKIFRSGQYSGLAMFYQPEPDVGEDDSIYHLNGAWEGEFNFPVRRFVHAFQGKNVEETQLSFKNGVKTYLKKIAQIPGMEPEKQGLAGVQELMKSELKSRIFEMSLLDFPDGLQESWMGMLSEVIPTSHLSLDYHQQALDELAVLLKKPMAQDKFVEWADRVWHSKELARTPNGIALSRQRQKRITETERGAA